MILLISDVVELKTIQQKWDIYNGKNTIKIDTTITDIYQTTKNIEILNRTVTSTHISVYDILYLSLSVYVLLFYYTHRTIVKNYL